MWKHGKIEIDGARFSWCAKVYDLPSVYGINGGRVSKLEIRGADGEILVNYDRGFDVESLNGSDAEKALLSLLAKFDVEAGKE